MLSITNLHVSYGDKPVLKGLTRDVQAGEAQAVMGPNGCVYVRMSPLWRTT